MDKNENWIETLLKAFALMGGAWLAVELIKVFGEKRIIYNCPNCGNEIPYKVKKCPHCEVNLNWEI